MQARFQQAGWQVNIKATMNALEVLQAQFLINNSHIWQAYADDVTDACLIPWDDACPE